VNVRFWQLGDSRLKTKAHSAQSFALRKAGNDIKYKDVESSIDWISGPTFYSIHFPFFAIPGGIFK
jgi:hypothetical protein